MTNNIIEIVNEQANSPMLVRMRCFRIAGIAVFDTLFTLIGAIVIFFTLHKYFPNYVFSIHHAIAVIFSVFAIGVFSHAIFSVNSKLNSYIAELLYSFADFLHKPGM